MSKIFLPSPAVSAAYHIKDDQISFLDAWGEEIIDITLFPHDYFGSSWNLPIEIPDKIIQHRLRLN